MFKINNLVNSHALLLMNWGNDYYVPMLYSSPQEELLACRNGAWLGNFLNCSPVYELSGPDVVKLMNYVRVNRDYSTLKVGGSRHTIMCNEKGQMLADGVMMRVDENRYLTYWLAPVLAYYVETLGYDVQGRWVTDEFFIQIDGPRSLEIMEKVSGKDLHSLKFAKHTEIEIAGVKTTIHRLGMSGCLAYEMHGDMNKVGEVYEAIAQAGEEYGLKRLGMMNYCRNHTQGGYPNQYIHFYYPFLLNDEKMKQYVIEHCGWNTQFCQYNFHGSAADDIENGFVNPYDVKWDYLINWDHDFIGKKALQEMAKAPARTVVTLEWNAEDIGKAFASQFTGTPVMPWDDISNIADGALLDFFVISKVMNGNQMIGVASGRERDFYHGNMISLAFINREYANVGDEYTVMWGSTPLSAQPIRVKVAPFPYYNEEMRNETFDVEKIPHPVF